MTIRQLEYFLTAAHTLSFTKTARQFFISQSAVTQQIRALENEFDTDLFLRSNNRIRLTPAGETLVPEAKLIVAKSREAVSKVHAARDGMNGKLRIGYLQSMELSHFPRTVQEFREDYPGIRMELNRDNAIRLHDDYLNGRYDMIFNVKNQLLRYPGSRQVTVGEYPFFVAVPQGHYFAQLRRVTQQDLQDEKLILHDFHLTVPESMEVTPRPYLSEENLKRVVATLDDIETILIFVAAGVGIAVVPEFDIYKPQINISLSYVPFDTGAYREKLEIVYPERDANPLLKFFLEKI